LTAEQQRHCIQQTNDDWEWREAEREETYSQWRQYRYLRRQLSTETSPPAKHKWRHGRKWQTYYCVARFFRCAADRIIISLMQQPTKHTTLTLNSITSCR
jgi:hypothetical protein